MILQKQHFFYNPYYVTVNNKAYTLGSIAVFNKNGIIAQNNQGWFGSNNEVAIRRIFDCDCVRKVKEDFNCKSAFIIREPKESAYADTRYILYLPDSVVKLDKPYTVKYDDFHLVTVRKSTIYPDIVFEKFRFFDRTLRALSREKNEICKRIEDPVWVWEDETLLSTVSELNEKCKEYLAEKHRLVEMSVEEALIEADKQEQAQKNNKKQ